VEHWIFPRLGLAQYRASMQGRLVNVPALVAWFVPLVIGFYAAFIAHWIHLFFLVLPVWFGASIIYMALAYLSPTRSEPAALKSGPLTSPEPLPSPTQKTQSSDSPPKPAIYYVCGFAAIVSLALCLVAAMYVAASPSDVYAARFQFFKKAIVFLTIMYFVAATIWIIIKDKGDASPTQA